MEPSRAELMGRRVLRHAERAGMPKPEIDCIERAHDLAMAVRVARLPDDHHPDFLHPGRTALILLTDAGVRDATLVAAGCIADSLRPELRVTPAKAVASLGATIVALAASVPSPADADDLAERLVTAPPETQLVALAERLDHARHLHLQPREDWSEAVALTCTVYMPVAQRTHPALHRRLRWWCGMFEERYLARL